MGVRGSLTSALVPFPRSNSGGERGCYGVRERVCYGVRG